MDNPGAQAAKPLIIACLPALNEEGTIAKIIVQAKPFVAKIFVCDDGSTDATASIASALGATVIHHPQPQGYGSAIASLFMAARDAGADIVVTLDADGQHDPRSIPALVEPITKGSADIVIGSRFLGGSDVPGIRKAGIKAINSVTKMATYSELTDTQSGFRAYGRAALGALKPGESGMSASTEILVKAKSLSLRVTEVPIVVTYGGSKPSQNTFAQGSSVFLNTIKHISIEHPFLLFGIPGFILLAVGFIFGGFGIDILLTSNHLPVNVALVSIGAILFGFMLITTMLMLLVLSSIVKELRPPSKIISPAFEQSGAAD
jgi:glycosyltransferase involved in cell wall biosynthesis